MITLAGYAYCAIASFSFLNRLPDSPSTASQKPRNGNGVSSATLSGLMDLPATIRWLVSRQIGYREHDDEDEDEEGDGHDHSLPLQDQRDAMAGTHKDSTEINSLASAVTS